VVHEPPHVLAERTEVSPNLLMSKDPLQTSLAYFQCSSKSKNYIL
jgi:hypothetical protein